MKIADSNIRLTASHSLAESHETRESLTVWSDPKTTAQTNNSPAVRVSLSPQARTASAGPTEDAPIDNLQEIGDFRLRILKLLIEKMTGRKIRIYSPEDSSPSCRCQNGATTTGTTAVDDNDRAGWGLIYDYEERHVEAETTRFSAGGTLRTEDGREINFSAELTMARAFASETRVSLRAGDALKDPLVLNFSGNAAELSGDRFAFDLNLDGSPDQMAKLAGDSGYLVLDRNGDGIVNDGSELFGPQSGDGFAELAGYDNDDNQWIDENDAVFTQLRIWTPDATGDGDLMSLDQVGVGALYLGRAETPFQQKDADNNLRGVTRSTGIYLNENGTVGTIQQLDLVV